jgi:hypothetical protein
MLRRLPIESAQPLVVFAAARLAVALAALVALVVLGFPYGGRGVGVVAGLGLPWTVALLLTARRNPEAVLHPLVAAGDIAVLLVIELVVPEAYGATRFTALFVLAAHAHFQGERRGFAIALAGSCALVAATALRGDTPLTGAPPSRPAGCAPATCRAGRSRRRARSAGGSRRRSTTARSRS